MAGFEHGQNGAKICPRLDKRCSAALLKLQRSRPSTVIGVITGNCIIVTHARRMRLSFTFAALGRRRSGGYGGSGLIVIHRYWLSETLHQKLRVNPAIGENVKL